VIKRLTSEQLVTLLSTVWRDVLGRPVGPDEDFFALGGTSIQAAMITNRVQEQVGALLHPAAIFDAPTISALATWYCSNHANIFGGSIEVPPSGSEGVLTPDDIGRARRYFEARHTSPDLAIDPSGGRNQSGIFILSPPRSGSTLLRVMLAGHPLLFSPPELYLLSFSTLKDRRAQLSGRIRFLGEGLVRALMALKRLDREGAEALVDRLADEGTSTHQIYALLQAWAPGRRLIDKTPAYTLHPMALRRAEAEFERPFFIHLIRHPLACVASFAEVRADLATGEYSDALPDSARKRGELWWLIGQSNIVEFLREVPEDRQCRVYFEELVADPEAIARGLCDRLGLPFVDGMLRPHADRENRMTDGVTEHSRMLGDQKFHQHRGIDPATADRWREDAREEPLCEQTWALAQALGYTREGSSQEREEWTL
jgi:hypothetical protein